MNNIDFFYINKLSGLHNNKNIFFCKTDYILEDFKTISKINNDIIFITGNSDYSITNELVDLAPPNIKTWYCQNALANNDIIYPIPIGMENKTDSNRIGHGISYNDRVTEKEYIINNLPHIIPNKFIYANFNINTNIEYRTYIKNLILNIEYIDWQESNLDLNTFYHSILTYKMVLCPIGNGIDTHRLWETLYCNRIPITIKVGNYKIYEMYKNLPIILLDSPEDLYNYNLIQDKYNHALNLSFDMITNTYWQNLIKNA